MEKFLKKLKKFILKNKLLSILILLFALIIIFGLVAIKVLIFPSYSTNKYGNRLKDIESVKLNNSRFNDIKSNFEVVEGFNIDKFRVSGRIVNIFVSVDDSLDINVVKESCMKLINGFSAEEIAYYDFQVFVTGSTDNEHYPMLGYKNKDSEGLYWNYEGGI